MLFYPGDDICNVRVTIPSDVDYEIIVLKTYRLLLDRFKELNPSRFNCKDHEQIYCYCEDESRKQLVVAYRAEQCKIISAQYSIVNSLLLVM